MSSEFVGKELTQEIKANWEEYLIATGTEDSWNFTLDFAKELFLSGFLYAGAERMYAPFIKPLPDTPQLTLYFDKHASELRGWHNDAVEKSLGTDMSVYDDLGNDEKEIYRHIARRVLKYSGKWRCLWN